MTDQTPDPEAAAAAAASAGLFTSPPSYFDQLRLTDQLVAIDERRTYTGDPIAWGRDEPWRWRCRYVDGEFGEHTAWHHDKDDRGWASSYSELMEQVLAHVMLHVSAGRVPPRPGLRGALYRVRGRIGLALRRRPR